ncbi:MAG: carbohydrate ABC transporter permease [Oscillospiraceae bacterium]
MSKKKKKKNSPNTGNVPAKVNRDNPENFITIEIPDAPEAETGADESLPEPSAGTQNAEHAEPVPESEQAPSVQPEAIDEPDTSDNPENEITIELPESEAEKVKKFIPQVTAPKKPPLTPEQIDAKKRRTRIFVSKTADVVLFVILVIAGLLMVLPIFYAVVQSLKSTAQLSEVPQSFFPRSLTFSSYVRLFTSTGKMGVPFYRFVFNTLFVSVAVTALRVVVSVPAAYALAKVKAPMIKTLNRLVELSLALTPALAFVGNYVFLAKTGLADTYLAVILPFVSSPLCVVLMREAIRRIPDETITAARMEGASHALIMRKFVSPQIKPAITATVILSLLETGRLSGGAFTFGETMDMLPTFMEHLHADGAVGEMYALAALMLIPTVALVVIFRKTILGLMTTAMLKDED